MANDHFCTYLSLTEKLTDWDVSQLGEVGLILLSFLAIDIDGIC